jgi:hypothetical protein
MTEPILVVDLGTSASTAALVLGDQVRLVKEPTTGLSRWPSSVCLDSDGTAVAAAAEWHRRMAPRRYVDGPRRAVDAQAAIWLGDREISGPDALVPFLAAVKAEGERFYGGQLHRAVLTVPASYQVPDPRRDILVAIGEAAGFQDAELLTDATAAALDPQAGPPVAEGGLVLVCDLGAVWGMTLLRRRGDDLVPVAQETMAAGQEIDSQLINGMRAEARVWLEPMLAADGDAGIRVYHDVVDFVRRLKHRLSDADWAEDHLTPLTPSLRLSREWLQAVMGPALDWAVGTGRRMLADAGTAVEVAVIVVGGASRLDATVSTIQSGLSRPVRHPSEPELAVARGAARWAMGARARRTVAETAKWRVEPVAWEIPGGQARVVRWLVDEGASYGAGDVLAQIATPDDVVFDLAAVHPGTLLAHRVPAGHIVETALVAAATKPATAMLEDPPTKRHELRADGEWFLTPDRRLLVECSDAGRCVRMRDIAAGTVLAEFRPEFNGDRPEQARVFVNPAGRLALLAWNGGGRFSVWDIESGRLQARFADSGGPHRVLVNEQQWRLTAAAERASAGRYQRVVTTVWDLRTGQRVEKLTQAAGQDAPAGYGDRSVADGFAASAGSPDGRLRAVVVRPPQGSTAVALHDVASEREVFRAERGDPQLARTAFSADGRYLLASWESGGASHLDVWEL